MQFSHQPDRVFHRDALQDRQLENFAQRGQFAIDRRFAALHLALADSIATNVFIFSMSKGEISAKVFLPKNSRKGLIKYSSSLYVSLFSRDQGSQTFSANSMKTESPTGLPPK